MYRITFYTPADKESPIKKFLDESSDSMRAKILRQFGYVEEFGLSHSIPNLKKLKNTPLWELRILGKENIRIFCVSKPDKIVKILHIFVKKTQKTPDGEISIALRRFP